MSTLSLFAELTVSQPVPPQARVKSDGRTYWADCARCGRGVLPATQPRRVRAPYGSSAPDRIVQSPVIVAQGYPAAALELRADSKGRHARATLGQCAGCLDVVPLRVIECEHSHADKPLERCGAACLNGRKSCSCRCGGKCHGAGVCTCGNR